MMAKRPSSSLLKSASIALAPLSSPARPSHYPCQLVHQLPGIIPQRRHLFNEAICLPPSSLMMLLCLATTIVSLLVIIVTSFLNNKPSAARLSSPEVCQHCPHAVDLHRQALPLGRDPHQLVDQPANIIPLQALQLSLQYHSSVMIPWQQVRPAPS
jgi:hypothetical protein